MLVFSSQSLAFIAVPKTGTTAVEMALKPRADIVFAKRNKHMTARRFHKKVLPFLKHTFGISPESMAVMREPEEQIRSWFRYRSRETNKGGDKGTHDLSFDEFVTAVISDDPPPFAGIGSQFRMLTSASGELLVNHLFAHETPEMFRGFLNHRFGEEIALGQRNVSPAIPAPLSPAIRARLRAARAREFDLYARLTEAGGHLQTPACGTPGRPRE